nr:cysteine peptidase family C39 domain-containing protein [uncultured Chryseobacterium sp.]
MDFNTLDEEVRSRVLYTRTKNHFVVVYKINKNNVVYISDPSYDLITYTQEEFIKDGLAKKPTKIPKKALL